MRRRPMVDAATLSAPEDSVMQFLFCVYCSQIRSCSPGMFSQFLFQFRMALFDHVVQ